MTISRFRTFLSGAAAALALAMWGPAGLVAQERLDVPSGQPLSFLEFIAEQDAELVRFRFLAPLIGTDYTYADVMDDFQALCDEQVIPVLAANGLTPRQIVLSMSASQVPFGEPAPDTVQFFELFRPENHTCIWEEF